MKDHFESLRASLRKEFAFRPQIPGTPSLDSPDDLDSRSGTPSCIKTPPRVLIRRRSNSPHQTGGQLFQKKVNCTFFNLNIEIEMTLKFRARSNRGILSANAGHPFKLALKVSDECDVFGQFLRETEEQRTFSDC
jgi:hypothetical protein